MTALVERDLTADEIIRNSGSSFSYTFSFLPQHKRTAIRTVYAFCRCTDDLVDSEASEAEKTRGLAAWKEEFELAMEGRSAYRILNQLVRIARDFSIPVDLFRQLIFGVEMDLNRRLYRSFEDLKDYCYHVASTVGLMCIEIFGYKSPRTRDYAVNLGIAMQLTNIIRDVRADAQDGRIYIPRDELDRFGVDLTRPSHLAYSDSFVDLMRLQTGRARAFYQNADVALPLEDRRRLLPARMMHNIYFRLLEKIEDRKHDVLSGRVSVSTGEKLATAFRTWMS